MRRFAKILTIIFPSICPESSRWRHRDSQSRSPTKSYKLDPRRRFILSVIRNPKFDTPFAQWDHPESPGAALIVLHEGQIIYQQGYGSANLEYGVPITPDTIFHVASISKQFTTMAITLLAADGKLTLDDEIHTHLPELPDFGHPITIRHLIHHTSGLRDQWALLKLAGWRMDDVITTEQILKLVGRQRSLNFPPGTEFLYSNTGYTFLAEIVKRVSGQTLREFSAARIFTPLGMSSTHVHDDHEEIVRNRAYSYKPNQSGGFRHSVLSYANAGATSLFTTIGDLARWLVNFDTSVVGTPALLQRFQEPYTLVNGETIAYASGLRWGDHRGVRFVGHSGSDAGYRTFTCRFPEHNLGIVVLSNLSTFRPDLRAMEVAEAFFGGRVALGLETPETPTVPAPSITISSEQLAEYTGRYYCEELDTTYQISEQGGELRLSHPRLMDMLFVATGVDAFRDKEPGTLSLAFFRESGQVAGLLMDWGRVRDVRFTRVG